MKNFVGLAGRLRSDLPEAFVILRLAGGRTENFVFSAQHLVFTQLTSSTIHHHSCIDTPSWPRRGLVNSSKKGVFDWMLAG